MGRREMKMAILLLLGRPDPAAILEATAAMAPRDLLGPLFSALCHRDELVRWHAVTVFGATVARMAGQDMESARIVMRRLLWSLNDESGGIGWGAPEAMAEVMYQCRPLAQEYLHMLVSYLREDGPEAFQDGNFIELPMLQRGLLWGIGRLVPRYRRSLAALGIKADLRRYLPSPDGDVRGLAVRCLLLLGDRLEGEEYDLLRQDRHRFTVYGGDGFVTCIVADLIDRGRRGAKGQAGNDGTGGRDHGAPASEV